MGNAMPKYKNEANLLKRMPALRAQIAELGNGGREMAISICPNELEGWHGWQKCTKHPGHEVFIPIRQLQLHHLPVAWRTQTIIEWIQYWAKCVVKLNVGYTSTERPDEFGCANLKGSRLVREGSGWADIDPSDLDETIECPLKNCPVSNEPHDVRQFTVITAAHVVCDVSEAERTVAEFFFDDPQDRSFIVRAYGVDMEHIDVAGDVCHMLCVTHDMGLLERIERKEYTNKTTHPPPSQETLSTLHSTLLGIVISHPHGMDKKVTIGGLEGLVDERSLSLADLQQFNEDVVRHGLKPRSYIIDTVDCRLCHSIQTCPGSSGAPVLVYRLHQSVLECHLAPHSGGVTRFKGMSGIGGFTKLPR